MHTFTYVVAERPQLQQKMKEDLRFHT